MGNLSRNVMGRRIWYVKNSRSGTDIDTLLHNVCGLSNLLGFMK